MAQDVTCLVLYSGGLDSILTCRLLQEQGIRVVALRFITPFFGYQYKGRETEEQARAHARYGVDLRIIDVSEPYLEIVRKPAYGYGRHFNPCVDCKIVMVRNTLARLGEFGASFVATGEVLGQRPMSQRRDTLPIIERDSGAKGRLLRPLTALRLSPTRMEEEGLVDRTRLLGICGRGRKEQIALAARYGITDYPAPSGGCILADPILSKRFRRLLDLWPDFGVGDALLAQVGRQFLLSDRSWLAVGRNQEENLRLLTLRQPGDTVLTVVNRPGPTALWRRVGTDRDEVFAGHILARYAKASHGSSEIEVADSEMAPRAIFVERPLADEATEAFRI